MAAAGSVQVRRVFISHCSADRKFVHRLLQILKQNRIRYWYSERHIPGATNWHDEIGQALKRCDWFLIVLSKKAVRSRWVKRELVYALRQNRYDGRVVPVLIASCKYDDLSWTLAAIEMIDFRGEFKTGCRRLLKVWGIRAKMKRAGRN